MLALLEVRLLEVVISVMSEVSKMSVASVLEALVVRLLVVCHWVVFLVPVVLIVPALVVCMVPVSVVSSSPSSAGMTAVYSQEQVLELNSWSSLHVFSLSLQMHWHERESRTSSELQLNSALLGHTHLQSWMSKTCSPVQSSTRKQTGGPGGLGGPGGPNGTQVQVLRSNLYPFLQ